MRTSFGMVVVAGICATIIAQPVAAADQPDFNRPYAVYLSMDEIAEKCLERGNNNCAIVCENMQETLINIYSSMTGGRRLSQSANLPQMSSQMQHFWMLCRERL